MSKFFNISLKFVKNYSYVSILFAKNFKIFLVCKIFQIFLKLLKLNIDLIEYFIIFLQIFTQNSLKFLILC